MKTTITCPQKMASVGEPSASKRPHIKTERMQEFIKSHGEVSNQKQYRCPYDGCTKVFTTQPGLRYHKKTHETGQDPVEYKCPQCFRTFKSSNGLKYHRTCRGKTRCEDGPPVTTGPKSEVQDDQQPSSTVTQLFQSHDLEEEVKVTDSEETSGICALSDTAVLTIDEDKERKEGLLPNSSVDVNTDTELKQGFNKRPQKKIPPKLDFPFADTQADTMQSTENRFTDNIGGSQGHSEEYHHFISLQTAVPHMTDHQLDDRSSGEFTELRPLLPSRPCYQYHQDNMDRKLIEDAGKLTEFAHFATSPQSPLMQTIMPWDKPTGPVVRSLNKSLDDCSPEPYKHCNKLYESVTMETTENIQHGLDLKADDCRHINFNTRDYLCEPDCMMDTNGNYFSDGSDPRVTSSSPFPVSPKDLSSPDGTWSHKWPTAIWQCFIADTQIYFVGEGEGVWHNVEFLAKREVLAQQAARHDTYHTHKYAENGLRLMSIQCCHGDGSSIKLFFTPDLSEQSDLWALCEVDHPFYVRDKGWCSHNQMLTAERYGIPCSRLEVGDVCLGPKHPDETFSNLSSDNATPSYEAAVYTLSSMAQQRNQRDLEQSPKSNNQNSPSRKRQLKLEPLKAKRPMNAFMLFAKEYRLEYTQKFPGKDNRAISVMLGDKWKKMSTDDRNVYAEKAKVLADQQKKIHPDCWKRKK